jgi:transcriptional regulator with XRE-family HTH domain
MDAKRLKQIIENKGYRYQWVADQAGISYASLLNYLSGKQKARTPTIRSIASVLGVAESELKSA